MRKGTVNRSDLSRARSRELRQKQSVAEAILWRLLRGRGTGYKFRRQYPAGPFYLDFFCRECSLAIELDGEQHAESKTYDLQRDLWLRGQDIEVIRIPTLDVIEPSRLDPWLELIESAASSE